MGVILHPVGGSVYSRMGVFKEISPRRDTAIFSEELKMVPPRKPLVLGTWFYIILCCLKCFSILLNVFLETSCVVQFIDFFCCDKPSLEKSRP